MCNAHASELRVRMPSADAASCLASGGGGPHKLPPFAARSPPVLVAAAPSQMLDWLLGPVPLQALTSSAALSDAPLSRTRVETGLLDCFAVADLPLACASCSWMAAVA